ncbi:MAG: hypothetical protein LBV29_03090 [Azoarcus sp.]|jgi:hypothetical protein|nr:hypothetical protein [Azoarcus sp.]
MAKYPSQIQPYMLAAAHQQAANDPGITPYKRLFAAKLVQHVKDYRQHRHKRRAPPEFHDAKTWLTSTDAEPATFNWTCSILDIDPEQARKTIFTEPEIRHAALR